MKMIIPNTKDTIGCATEVKQPALPNIWYTVDYSPSRHTWKNNINKKHDVNNIEQIQESLEKGNLRNITTPKPKPTPAPQKRK